MGNLQVLFIILFGIYFATIVSTTGKLYPFDTTAAVAGDWRALLRGVVALLVLDLAPFGYFVWVLKRLPGSSTDFTSAWQPAVGVLFASLAMFGIYRFFLAIMMIRRKGSKLFFYAEPDDWPSTQLRSRLATGRFPDKAGAAPFSTVFIGGALWVVMCLAVFLSTN